MVFSNSGEKVSMCHFSNLFFVCFLLHRVPEMVLKRIHNYLKMVPNGPPQIPIPGVSKSLLLGVKQIKEKHMFDDCPFFEIKKVRCQSA